MGLHGGAWDGFRGREDIPDRSWQVVVDSKKLDALVQDYLKATAPKMDLEQTNEGLEDDFPLQVGDFQIPCWFSRVYIPAHITGMAPKIWLCRDTWISQWKMLSIYRREKNHDGFQEYSYFILFLVFLGVFW